MGYFEQSPELRHNGEKYQSPHGWGKAIRTHELETAINRCLGPKDSAMVKIMYFLTGNAEGFRVSERTILERCNISESGYKKARKKLAEKQWIFHQAGEYIQVNFNKIFSDYRALEVGCPQEPSQKTVTVETEKNMSNPSETFTVTPAGDSEGVKSGTPENTYNNINNSIKDNIKNISDKGNRCEDTRSEVANATSPQASSQPLRDYTRAEIEKAMNDYFDWYGHEEVLIQRKYNYAQSNDDFIRMVNSEEYNALENEALERRKAIEQKYGKVFPHKRSENDV